MMKRNDGYALSYVLVVMLLLAAIAVAVMTMSMQVMKNQQTSIQRMQDRYTAQGLVEQVIAQLERTDDVNSIIGEYAPTEGEDLPNPCCTIVENSNPITYRIVASDNKTTVTVEFTLEQVFKKENTGTDEDGNPIVSETPNGHTVTYISYNTEVAP